MSMTTTLPLDPGEWAVVAPLGNVHMIQVKDRKAVRLHFGDIRHPPAIDTEDFIVMSDYDPKPLALEYLAASYPQACLFAMPDGASPAKITTVLLPILSPAINPDAGALSAMKVGTYHKRRFALIGANANVEFSVASGALPAGVTLSSDGELLGTPITAGAYSFTIRADYDGGNVSAAYTLTVNP